MFSVGNILYMLTSRGGLRPIVNAFQSAHMTTQSNAGALVEMVRSFIPPLCSGSHKGQAGRIGVIGGCQEYTGAPYFSAISALKVGADLAHVFCTHDASTVIKSYSPELIVHPVLDHPSAHSEISKWLERLHAVVVGPGLGRNRTVLDNVKSVLNEVKSRELPLVIDADGLYLVTEDVDIIRNYRLGILTPNMMEFSRLYEKMFDAKPHSEDPVSDVKALSHALGNVTIVRKGENDIISDGHKVLICTAEGSHRRCGGQGDLLSGAMGTFTYWAHKAVADGTKNELLTEFGPTIAAAYAACLLTKDCSLRAFKTCGRAMMTSDMIAKIAPAYHQLYE